MQVPPFKHGLALHCSADNRLRTTTAQTKSEIAEEPYLIGHPPSVTMLTVKKMNKEGQRWTRFRVLEIVLLRLESTNQSRLFGKNITDGKDNRRDDVKAIRPVKHDSNSIFDVPPWLNCSLFKVNSIRLVSFNCSLGTGFGSGCSARRFVVLWSCFIVVLLMFRSSAQ